MVLNDLGEEEVLDVSGQVIVLPEDVKIEPVIDRYILRTNYFVEYLHFDNNGRLDGFLDHKNNMYVLNNEYDTRKEICNKLTSTRRMTLFGQIRVTQVLPPVCTNRCVVICLRVNTTLHKC